MKSIVVLDSQELSGPVTADEASWLNETANPGLLDCPPKVGTQGFASVPQGVKSSG